MSRTLIFTEAYNCGKIARKALESFAKYHKQTVHVVGTHKDFKELKGLKNIEIIDVSSDEHLKQLYKNGHLGTAYIFAKAITRRYGNFDRVIHFDSDVIFRSECISDIQQGFEEGYDLIGQRRCYDNNRCNRDDIRGIGLADVVGTCFFGVNVDSISKYDFTTIQKMIVGYHNPFNHPILDFFDPVSFDIMNNGGKIKYLDFKDYGSTNASGSLDNGYEEINSIFDFGDKFIHFAGIGSGMNFYYNGNGNVPPTYTEWAKKRFSLYMKVFYDEDIDFEYDQKDYELLKKHF